MHQKLVPDPFLILVNWATADSTSIKFDPFEGVLKSWWMMVSLGL